VKEKPAAKLRKRRGSDDEMSMSTPAPGSSVDRRRSNRGASAKKSYADRDDSEDDEEMWDGVAQWEYIKDSEIGEGRSDVEDSEPEVEPEDIVEEPEDGKHDSLDLDPDEVEEEAALTPLPARKIGRPTKATPSKPSPAAKVVQPKPKPKSAALVVGKGKGKQTKLVSEKLSSTKGKGKAKEKVKDVFDMDDDSD
jgi:sister-chromatid-cohesion protein PDS5